MLKLTFDEFALGGYPQKGPVSEVGMGMRNDIERSGSSELRSERLKSLGMIASGIAHDLNGPLATVKACSQGLLKRLLKDNIDRTLFKEYLEIIEEEIGRCTYITNAILRFLRQEKGSYDQGVDIHASLDKTIEMVRLQERCGETAIVRNYEKSAAIVLGNECELRQAFLSIIGNALEIETEPYANRGNTA